MADMPAEAPSSAASTSGLLSELHDGLLTKCLCQHGPPTQARLVPTAKDQHPWHRFVDQLSNLAQIQSAENVVSIAAEQRTPQQVIFWDLVKPGGCQDVTRRLGVILEHLKRSLDARPQAGLEICNNLVDGLARDCIVGLPHKAFLERFPNLCGAHEGEAMQGCPQRVKNYQHQLAEVLKDIDADPNSQDGSHEESALLASLWDLARSCPDHWRLCQKAFDLRNSQQYQTFRRKTKNEAGRNWERARHFVGRLSSWHMAARFVFKHAARFARILRNCQVEEVPFRSDASSRVSIKIDPSIRSLLSRCFPTLDHNDMTKTAARRLASAKDLLKKLQSRQQIPMVHAEAMMLHHFYTNKLQFVDGDKYIGCSKPSCYTCGLFFRLHPGNFTQRPCHQRAWLKWLPPGYSPNDPEMTELLRKIVEHMKKDVAADILGNRFSELPMFDSTTGRSVSFREILSTAGW